MNLDQFTTALESVDGLEAFQSVAVGIRDALEIDHIVYHWVSSDGEQYGVGTYAPEWAARYAERDYLRVDPVIIASFQKFHPVDWRRLDWSSKAARGFQEDAQAFGVGTQGYSIPVRGPVGQFALLTASHSCSDAEWDDFIATHQQQLLLLAHYCNRTALRLESGRMPDAHKPLSPREIDALTYLAMGYGRGQAANMLAISEHTLRAYIESARFKLGAANTTHAVARALAEGLIIVGAAVRGADGDWPGKAEEEIGKALVPRATVGP